MWNGSLKLKMQKVWTIASGYEIRSLSQEDFDPQFHKFTETYFDDATQVFRLRDSLEDTERDKIRNLSSNLGSPFTLRLGVFHKQEMVGWHFGRQDGPFSFYMINSGILPEHRRKGLYMELVKRVLSLTVEEGFQTIWSRHRATNNGVIIPKLRQGFVITGIEITDTFGTLVHLSYFPKEIRRKVLDYRVGHIRPDKEIIRALRLENL